MKRHSTNSKVHQLSRRLVTLTVALLLIGCHHSAAVSVDQAAAFKASDKVPLKMLQQICSIPNYPCASATDEAPIAEVTVWRDERGFAKRVGFQCSDTVISHPPLSFYDMNGVHVGTIADEPLAKDNKANYEEKWKTLAPGLTKAESFACNDIDILTRCSDNARDTDGYTELECASTRARIIGTEQTFREWGP